MPVPTKISLVSYKLPRNVLLLLGEARSHSNRVITYYFARFFAVSKHSTSQTSTLEATVVSCIFCQYPCFLRTWRHFNNCTYTMKVIVVRISVKKKMANEKSHIEPKLTSKIHQNRIIPESDRLYKTIG